MDSPPREGLLSAAAVTIPLEEILGVVMAEAEGAPGVGDSAVALLVRAYAWAAERATDGYLPASILGRLTSHKTPSKVLAALEEVGLLVPHGLGYRLAGYLSANPSRAEIEAKRAREAAKKAGQRKGDSTGDTGRESPGESPTMSPGESPGESLGDTGGDNASPLSHSPLSPETKNPRDQKGGERASELASPRESLGESPRDSGGDRGQESPGDNPPSSAPSSVQAPQKRPQKHALGRSLAPVWAAGVSLVTGSSVASALEAWNLAALESIAGAHCQGLTGSALEAAIGELAADYTRACRDGDRDRAKGYSPELGLAWLNAGRPAARPSRAAPPQPAPAGGREWAPAIDSRKLVGGAR